MASNLDLALERAGENARAAEGISIKTFVASLATAFIVFAGQVCLFLLMRGRFIRIYQPRTYLVSNRELTKPAPPGLFRWISPVFQTPSSELIQKCGLDAYFFLRYLRMLLKIFVPLGLLILPVLLPINFVSGEGVPYQKGAEIGARWNVTGLDQLSWINIKPKHASRYWAHLIMAVVVVFYTCAVFFEEMSEYIRLRHDYMVSPRHRLRASATTVLVTAIPRGWRSVEALESLFDVFPGGIRHIWINRNFDNLSKKVKLRDNIAHKLEAAETKLIIKCKKAVMKTSHPGAKKLKKGRMSTKDLGRSDTGKRATRMSAELAVNFDVLRQSSTLPEDFYRQLEVGQQSTSAIGTSQGLAPLHLPVQSEVGKANKSMLGGLKEIQNCPGSARSRNDGCREMTDAARLYHEDTTSANDRNSSINGAIALKHETREAEYCDEYTAINVPPKALADIRCRGPAEAKTFRQETSNQKYLIVEDDMNGRDDPVSYSEYSRFEDHGEPIWSRFVRKKDRETLRLPVFGWAWMPSLWFIGTKVDTIDHCRNELARLNLEIEVDQRHPERFPLMNSAFIQFNKQVAAHMACQSVTHHLPKKMAPRILEVCPDDVIWDNMSIRWWERYLRTFGIITIVCVMLVGWSFPIAFTGLLSQLTFIEGAFTWLSWLRNLPNWLLAAIQGILPTLFWSILMVLLPLVLRFLSRMQGLHTGMAVELVVQNYYFAFLFVQLFLIVAIATGFSTSLDTSNMTGLAEILAQNIPRSSNYFFSYMILQAMSVSAGALLQIFNFANWFILAPTSDSTAREKWARTTSLIEIQWGTFFPFYTTLASIGLIYCVVAPLILVFNIVTFSLFWFVYRYNVLYVIKFRFDTGGLLFPRAINQLFAGLYVMELCLIGLFFLVRDDNGEVACAAQGICMAIVLILTAGYQLILNEAFGPLIRYLPITLEDNAVCRDEEFRYADRARLRRTVYDGENESADWRFANRKAGDRHQNNDALGIELDRLRPEQGGRKQHGSIVHLPEQPLRTTFSNAFHNKHIRSDLPQSRPTMVNNIVCNAEADGPSTNTTCPSLFKRNYDELGDLTPDDRNYLVERAFQHEALRAKRPVIWIPRDDLGVSDDEVYRTQLFSRYIWINNENQTLDGKCRTIFSRSPPDFSDTDLVQL